MSKLKRRKTVVEEIKPDHQFRISDQHESLRIPDATPHRRTEGSPSAGERSSCWTLSDPTDVEKLWMKTLQALCPQFSAQDTSHGVPDLPPLSVKEKKQSVQRWCSLDEDVPPLPNPQSLRPVPLSVPFPSSPPVSAPDLQERSACVSVQTTPNSFSAENHQPDVSTSEKDPNSATAGFSGSGAEQSRLESDSDAGAGTLRTSEIQPELGINTGSKPEIDDEARRRSAQDGGRMECCPMCLMVFPAGFSQLECDGHLAQCLSEMNVDVVW